MSSFETRTILAVDLDYFYAQCEEVRRPDLRGKPVVICVFSGRTEESGAVSTCNYVARDLGVKSGIPIVQAKKILSKYPKAVFLPMDKEYYETVSEQIMEILRSHTKRMEQVSIDEAYLDTTERTRGDFQVAQDIGSNIRIQILEKQHLTCSVGIGPNKLVAKMAVSSKKPDAMTVIHPDIVRTFLNPLPVGKLFGVGPKTEKKLKVLGINTIQDLGNYDEIRLADEFGKNLGPQLKRSAQGIDDDPVQERELEQLSRIVTLKRNAVSYDFTSDIESLCNDISSKLVAKGLTCKSVGIIAIASDLKVKSRARALESPTDSSQNISSAASHLFKTFFAENHIEVRRAGVKVSALAQQKQVTRTEGTLTDFMG